MLNIKIAMTNNEVFRRAEKILNEYVEKRFENDDEAYDFLCEYGFKTIDACGSDESIENMNQVFAYIQREKYIKTEDHGV